MSGKIVTCSITCPECGFTSKHQRFPVGKEWGCGYCGKKTPVEVLNEEEKVAGKPGEPAPTIPTPPEVKPPEVPK